MNNLRGYLLISLSLWSLSVAANIRETIDHMCVKHKASDCDLVHAIAWQETRYRNETVFDVNSFSFGPLQVKCATARLKVLKASLKFSCDQLEDPMVSIRFAIYYLEYQLERYGGDIKKALSAYNMGTAVVCKNHNPGHCYMGEFYNYDYVNETWRRYKWLKKKKQKQIVRFLQSFKR